MFKIYLARHGQDEDNLAGILNGRRDEPLTKIGAEQALQLSLKIEAAGLKFDTVYSSPLKRAYKTAEIVTNQLGLSKPIALDTLIERDFGVMTGKPVKDIEDLCAPHIIKTGNVIYFLSPNDAETFPQLLERARNVLAKIRENHQEGNVLLVTHGDFGKMLYAAYYDLEWQRTLTMFHFGNSELLLLSKDSTPEETHVFATAQHNY